MFAENLKVYDVKLEMGKLVKVLRKRQKYTQQVLADRLNLSRITIQNIESGKNFTIDSYLLVLQHFEELTTWTTFVKETINNHENVEDLY